MEYCFSNDAAQRSCEDYCNDQRNSAECAEWEQAYDRTRGGRGGGRERGRGGEEDDARRLAEMKKGFKEWLENFRDTERRVKKLQSRKVTIPAEIAEAVTVIKGMGAAVESATTITELEELGQKLQDAVETINEGLPSLERLADFGRVLRDVDRQIRSVDTAWKRLERRARSISSQTDIDEQIAQQLVEAKQNREAAVAAAGAGNGDDAFDALQAVFIALDEVQEKFRALETIISAPRELTRARREVANFERDLTRLARRGIEIGKARNLLDEVKDRLVFVSKLVEKRPFPIDDIVASSEEFEDAKDIFLLELDELRGTKKDIIPTPGPEPFPLELPPGFERSPEAPFSLFGPAT